jgi:hypothetical protein
MWRSVVAGTMVLALAGCGRDAVPPAGHATAGEAPATSAASATATPEAVAMTDVIERDPRYLVGISYPPEAARYPGLARLLKDYAEAARGDLMHAVKGLGDDKPTAPYDLSLAFTMLASTPRIVTVAADGSSYTGGAHGNPLLARFTWLPAEREQLTAAKLVPDPAGWQVVSEYVREQLASDLSQRVDGAGPAAGERARLMEGGLQMIDQGTTPEAANFDQFEPVLDATGRIVALRFVFPPYQVGPYSDGAQSVEVPARVLLPVVAASYRPLFRDS